MRITGGHLRGRRIKTPGDGTHPMGERERIALFNMLQAFIPGSFVMDLYCGGGTLGIETLSRGADFALFIDNNPRAVAVVNDNLTKLDILGITKPSTPELKGTGNAIVSDISKITSKAASRYNLFIADPPYDSYSEEMVDFLPQLMPSGSILALSHPGEAPVLTGLTLQKSHSYARATISIYRKD